jgi:DNA invertase Pin-like site-specific DNA recombinase
MIGDGRPEKKILHCAVYTRKSTEEGLEQEFNSLDAQREAGENYIASQQHEGWMLLPERYDDGGFSGGSMERPALQRLMRHIEDGKVDVLVCYKIDRVSRSLLDFARLMAILEKHNVALVSVTQQFNSGTPMGRLILNILFSFAQYERDIIQERIRDKIAMAKKRGKNCGGVPPLGYDIVGGKLVINPKEAELVREIFTRFLEVGSAAEVARRLREEGKTTKDWITKKGTPHKGKPLQANAIYNVLHNRKYVGDMPHLDKVYKGEQEAIVTREQWDRAHEALAVRTVAHTRLKRKSPTLLRGVLKCGYCGRSMTSDYSMKNGRRYFYYQCVRSRKEPDDPCPVRSVPAGTIEKAVIDQLRAVFRQPELIERILSAVGDERPLDEVALVRNLTELDGVWDSLFSAERARIAQLLLVKAIVRPEELEIHVRTEGFADLAAELVAENSPRPTRRYRTGNVTPAKDCPVEVTTLPGGEAVRIVVKIRFAVRHCGHHEIILPESVKNEDPGYSPLVQNLARGFRWQEMIDRGKAENALELARILGFDPALVSRNIRLTLLSPRIVEDALAGNDPKGLTLYKARHELPLLWEDQERESSQA